MTRSIANNDPATSFMRPKPEVGEEVLCVRIGSLALAHPIVSEEFGREENGYHSFVDQVAHIIGGSVDAGNGFPSVGVSTKFSPGVPLSVGPVGGIIRIHSGGYGLKFVTINHILVGEEQCWKMGVKQYY